LPARAGGRPGGAAVHPGLARGVGRRRAALGVAERLARPAGAAPGDPRAAPPAGAGERPPFAGRRGGADGRRGGHGRRPAEPAGAARIRPLRCRTVAGRPGGEPDLRGARPGAGAAAALAAWRGLLFAGRGRRRPRPPGRGLRGAGQGAAVPGRRRRRSGPRRRRGNDRAPLIGRGGRCAVLRPRLRGNDGRLAGAAARRGLRAVRRHALAGRRNGPRRGGRENGRAHGPHERGRAGGDAGRLRGARRASARPHPPEQHQPRAAGRQPGACGRRSGGLGGGGRRDGAAAV
ncbi:MAG: Coenzyme PQQ synthesis protein B, partial [uncultured Acetobacteraceae bacterium]